MNKKNNSNEAVKGTKGEKIVAFLKHNAYYLIMALCLIAIITMVSVAVVGVNNQDNTQVVKPEDKDDPPVVVIPDMDFILPVSGAKIVNNYSDENSLYYNPILDQYCFHGGIDFATTDKAMVVAVLDGEVIKSQKHKMYGYVVEIKHAKDIVTVYRSLADVKVKVGDKVKKGDVLGYTSASDISESNFGNHVHFEMFEKNVNINPNKYLTLEEK